MALMEIINLSKNFGKLAAISNLDLNINKGEIHGLIGPNGAGKTTLFNLITNFHPATSGEIFFNKEEITKLEPHQIAQRGIARSFQQTFLFMQSTVLDNVLMGFHMNLRTGALKEFLHTPAAREADQKAREQASEILELMGLGAQKNQMAKNLPHGHQRALGICIALACNPILLMMDEPVSGMNPTEEAEMVRRIKKIRDRGITIILVEHSMRVVMNLCGRITVLNYGRKIAEGPSDEIIQNKEVIAAYLGKED